MAFYTSLNESANEGFPARNVSANVQYSFNDYQPKATDSSLRAIVNDNKLNKLKRMELYAMQY